MMVIVLLLIQFHINSFIKLDFKVNYICSNETDQTISFRVKNNHNEIIFADLSLGTLWVLQIKEYIMDYISILQDIMHQ